MGTLTKNNGRKNAFPGPSTFFDDFLTRDLFNWSPVTGHQFQSLPAVNVKERADSFELEVAAPGMKKEDFNVELDNNTLRISASCEYSSESSEDDDGYSRREFGYQNFERSFTLPEQAVMADKIKATYRDGILLVHIPKAEEAKRKPAKTIQIL